MVVSRRGWSRWLWRGRGSIEGGLHFYVFDPWRGWERIRSLTTAPINSVVDVKRLRQEEFSI